VSPFYIGLGVGIFIGIFLGICFLGLFWINRREEHEPDKYSGRIPRRPPIAVVRMMMN
jgi:hypothetical protein